MDTNPFPFVTRPSLIIDPEKAMNNLRDMTAKAVQQGLELRPHFKTHQSGEIGEWFRKESVKSITVSSVKMGHYFSDAGWSDICVALPANPREADSINALARKTSLSLIADNPLSLSLLEENLDHPISIWIETDTGDGRSGVNWDDGFALVEMAKRLKNSKKLSFKGLIAHAGNSYASRGQDEILKVHEEAMSRLTHAKKTLNKAGYPVIECSYGDTPTCSISTHFEGLTELRPGNFIFYDCMQQQISACTFDQIAVALAAPVISVRPNKGQIIVHGGAVHLSKDSLLVGGERIYGRLAIAQKGKWGQPREDLKLSKLSQEHGIIHGSQEVVAQFKPGDVLMILPVHSCLTANLMTDYYLPDGSTLTGMR